MAKEGLPTHNHLPILEDVYDIVRRLKEIDRGYFVMLNRISGHFEVHHSEQKGDTLACTIPFGELDERTVMLVRESSIYRVHHYLKKLDGYNEKLQKHQTKEAVARIAERVQETGNAF